MPFVRGVLNSLAVEFVRIGVDWIGAVANYRLTSVDGRRHVTRGHIRCIRCFLRFRNQLKSKLTRFYLITTI